MDGAPGWIPGQDRLTETSLVVLASAAAFVGPVAWFAAGGSVLLLFVAMGGAIGMAVGSAGLTAAREQRRRAYRVTGPAPGVLEVRDPVAGDRVHRLEDLLRLGRTTANRPRDAWWTLAFEDGTEVKVQGEPGERVVGLVRARRPDVALEVRSLGDGGSGGS